MCFANVFTFIGENTQNDGFLHEETEIELDEEKDESETAESVIMAIAGRQDKSWRDPHNPHKLEQLLAGLVGN